MSEQTVKAFYRIRFFFGLLVNLRRDKFRICLPIICFNLLDRMGQQFIPQLYARFRSAGTQHDIDDSFPNPINSHPYPAIVFFPLTYECISSISTTSILPSAFLRDSIFLPYSLTQFITVTLLTFKNRSIDRKPRPSKYNSNAALFISGGFPRCCTVK
jgi:hypothetical protein